MSSFARELPLEGVHNFRDYGGYATRGGGRLRTGRLFRSGQHVGATPADLEAIAGLGIVAIVDLRGDSERRLAPCRRPDGFSAKVRFATEETAGLAPHVEAAAKVDTADAAAAAMRVGYAEIPFRPRLSQALRMYFEVLAEEDGPTLVHCMAGKDRTGFAVALLHTLLGVHPDDIAADYLLTNTAANAEARIAAGAAMMREGEGIVLSDAAVRTLMGVHPSYLEVAFDAVRARHGGVDAYMQDVLGVTPARREAIASHLVGLNVGKPEPSMIELYYWPTPNGHKITLFLEETGVDYQIHPINIGAGEQFQPDYLAFSPNNRMPAIIDRAPTDGGEAIGIFESGAILVYLAEKTGRFLPADVRGRKSVLEWLFWQVGGLGPMAGQNHHFGQYAPEKIPYAITRYVNETNRLYGVMDRRLATSAYLGGADYSIADMAAYPWVVPHERQQQKLEDFPHVKRWFDAIAARPATVRAYAKAEAIAARPPTDEAERKILFGQTATTLSQP